MNAILGFYGLRNPDARGRMLEDIWQWDDRRLETTHDYIQWLFPLPEVSKFNPSAPTLSSEIIEEFRSDRLLQSRLRRSLQVMLKFYGLCSRYENLSEPKFEPGPDFETKQTNWLIKDNHNHLRLTRILASTTLLGLGESSRALFECLEHINHSFPNRISERTIQFWRITQTQP